MHADTQTHRHTHRHIRIRIRIHIHMHMHMRMRACIHTCIHTYIRLKAQASPPFGLACGGPTWTLRSSSSVASAASLSTRCMQAGAGAINAARTQDAATGFGTIEYVKVMCAGNADRVGPNQPTVSPSRSLPLQRGMVKDNGPLPHHLVLEDTGKDGIRPRLTF